MLLACFTASMNAIYSRTCSRSQTAALNQGNNAHGYIAGEDSKYGSKRNLGTYVGLQPTFRTNVEDFCN